MWVDPWCCVPQPMRTVAKGNTALQVPLGWRTNSGKTAIDLIIHAGLSKTATTTVQNLLLKGVPHYFGRDDEGDGAFVLELMELARRWPFMPSAEVASRTRAWADSLAAEARARGAASALVSCEQLLNWRICDNDFRKGGLAVSPRNLPWCQARRTGNWPLATFLADHLVKVWSQYGAVRVVVALRRQPDWLASQYAQISARLWAPSQRDFEAQVSELIGREDHYLFWDRMVTDLSSALGSENLHVFFFEDLCLPETWTELAYQLGIAEGDPRIDRARLARTNQRSTTRLQDWAIRPSRGRLLEQAVDITWAEGALPGLRPVALKAAAVFDRMISSRLAGRPKTEEKPVIRLSKETTAMIKEYCRASNLRLSELMSRDLESLGYLERLPEKGSTSVQVVVNGNFGLEAKRGILVHERQESLE